MNIQLLVESIRQVKFPGPAANIGEGRLGRFLHHIPQFPRENELPPPLENVHFRGQNISPRFRPRHAGGDTYHGFLHAAGAKEFRPAQIILQLADGNFDRRFPFLHHRPSGSAADLPNAPLQFPHPRFPRVGRDDLSNDARP